MQRSTIVSCPRRYDVDVGTTGDQDISGNLVRIDLAPGPNSKFFVILTINPAFMHWIGDCRHSRGVHTHQSPRKDYRLRFCRNEGWLRAVGCLRSPSRIAAHILEVQYDPAEPCRIIKPHTYVGDDDCAISSHGEVGQIRELVGPADCDWGRAVCCHVKSVGTCRKLNVIMSVSRAAVKQIQSSPTYVDVSCSLTCGTFIYVDIRFIQSQGGENLSLWIQQNSSWPASCCCTIVSGVVGQMRAIRASSWVIQR